MTHYEALANEYEKLTNRVHNLNLYLDYLRETVISPDDWKKLEDNFSGLPGYANDTVWEQE